MYYLLIAVFLIIVYFALAKFLSSVVKGCLITLGLLILIGLGYLMFKSTRTPVTIFNRYQIDNFEVKKI